MRRATEPLHYPTRAAQLRQMMKDVAVDEAGALFPRNTRLTRGKSRRNWRILASGLVKIHHEY